MYISHNPLIRVYVCHRNNTPQLLNSCDHSLDLLHLTQYSLYVSKSPQLLTTLLLSNYSLSWAYSTKRQMQCFFLDFCHGRSAELEGSGLTFSTGMYPL
jgi:hypothetical protein